MSERHDNSRGTGAQTPGRTEFRYIDSHGIEIVAYRWGPPAASHDTDVIAGILDSGPPHGIVQISHGIGEHALRYDGFARALVQAGFIVYADDHRGHGETGRAQWDGDLSKLGRLGPGGLRATEAAILQLTGIIREQNPGVPLTMFGHSWGSLMAQRILNREPRTFDAVVLSGSAFRTPRYMESGDLNTRWKGPHPDGSPASGFEWLSRDAEVAAEFIADPLCFSADILKLFGLADSLRFYGTPAHGLAEDVPILIVSGSDDPLSRGDGLQKLAEAYRARGVRNVTLRVYPEARHELLNETNRAEATADIIAWITDRVSNPSL